MKKYLLIISFFSLNLFAQKPGYYNGTEGKTGDELKAALHEIINDHIDFSYSDAKYILEYAQEDPANSSNLIQFYTGLSLAKDGWGTDGNDHNREHVWAKSHGDFADIRPMDGDAHNLHAADASVNVTRSNYDFDFVTEGTYIEEADAYYNSGDDAFEPADREKGEVARTIFYMAVRYEGTKGEMDLEVVDALNTSFNAEHGKLSTLLQWNRDFPPTDFERRRNDRVEQSQGNRNPFTDNPAWADMIWGDQAMESEIEFYELNSSPVYPKAGEPIALSFKVDSVDEVKFYWGNTYDAYPNEVMLTASPDLPSYYVAEFTPNSVNGGELVYCKMLATKGGVKDSMFSNFYLEPDGQVVTISAVQGTGDASPLADQNIAIAGVVTANFDNIFFVQNGDDIRDGVPVYSNFRGHIGDSVKVVGKAVEYNNLTEISNVTAVYNYGPVGEKEPQVITINEIGEDYEGVLVEIQKVSFNEGGSTFPSGDTYPYPTFTVSDGVNDITFYTRYNSRLNNMPIPNGMVNVKGVISQYKDGYQIMSNDTSWFTPAVDNVPPQIISVELEDRTDKYVWMYVNFNEIVVEEDVEEEDNFSVSDGVVIKRNYFSSTTPNQAKIIIENIGVGDYTLTVSNIKDAFGNAMSSTTFNFSSDINKTTAISEQEAAQLVTLYPNPVINGNVEVSSQDLIKSLSIYTLSGQLLYAETGINSKSKHLNLESLNVGHYLLQVNTVNQSITRKITIK